MKHAAAFLLLALTLTLTGCQKNSSITDHGIASDGASNVQGTLFKTVVPDPVENLTVAVSGRTATVTWNEVAGADDYNILIAQNETTVREETVTSASYVAANLPNGTYTVKVSVRTFNGDLGAYRWSDAVPFTIAEYTLQCWRPPVSLAGKVFKSGSTVPVKFIVVDAGGRPVADGLNVTVTIGTVSAQAVPDDASLGQWKAEIRLAGRGDETVSLSGTIAPASMSIKVK